jgi:hypothetical protein
MSHGRSEHKVVRQANIKDIRTVSEGMRSDDAREAKALGYDPKAALASSCIYSDKVFAVVDDNDTAVALFGVGPHTLDNELLVGCCWLVGTDGFPKVALRSARIVPGCVDELHTDYPVLWNWVDVRNTVHVRWLKWLGFEFLNTAPRGKNGELFHQFIRIK